MNPRDKHMLEVFQGLGSSESPEPPPTPPPPPAERPPRPPRRPVPGLSGRPPAPLIALVVVAFLVGLLVGRVTAPASEVEAEEPRTTDPLAFLERERPSSPPPTQRAESQENEDVFAAMRGALLDPENEYTVLAITYDLNETNRALAVATARHFVARGLPVCEPYERGQLLYIMVGASPSSRDLADLVERVREQLDPAGRRDQYRSAYVERIDTIVSGR